MTLTCAPMALRLLAAPSRFEFDPVIAGRHGVAIQQQRAAFVGDDRIEHAAISEIGQGDGAAVVDIGYADQLSHLFELAGTVVDPDASFVDSRRGCGRRGGASWRHSEMMAWLPPATFE